MYAHVLQLVIGVALMATSFALHASSGGADVPYVLLTMGVGGFLVGLLSLIGLASPPQERHARGKRVLSAAVRILTLRRKIGNAGLNNIGLAEKINLQARLDDALGHVVDDSLEAAARLRRDCLAILNDVKDMRTVSVHLKTSLVMMLQEIVDGIGTELGDGSPESLAILRRTGSAAFPVDKTAP